LNHRGVFSEELTTKLGLLRFGGGGGSQAGACID
jgi:hypothetical protein